MFGAAVDARRTALQAQRIGRADLDALRAGRTPTRIATPCAVAATWQIGDAEVTGTTLRRRGALVTDRRRGGGARAGRADLGRAASHARCPTDPARRNRGPGLTDTGRTTASASAAYAAGWRTARATGHDRERTEGSGKADHGSHRSPRAQRLLQRRNADSNLGRNSAGSRDACPRTATQPDGCAASASAAAARRCASDALSRTGRSAGSRREGDSVRPAPRTADSRTTNGWSPSWASCVISAGARGLPSATTPSSARALRVGSAAGSSAISSRIGTASGPKVRQRWAEIGPSRERRSASTAPRRSDSLADALVAPCRAADAGGPETAITKTAANATMAPLLATCTRQPRSELQSMSSETLRRSAGTTHPSSGTPPERDSWHGRAQARLPRSMTNRYRTSPRTSRS